MAKEERMQRASLRKYMPLHVVDTKPEVFVLDEPEGLAVPKEHPSSEYQEITKGLFKSVEEIYRAGKISDINQFTFGCCFEFCCVSWCCIRITIDIDIDFK